MDNVKDTIDPPNVTYEMYLHELNLNIALRKELAERTEELERFQRRNKQQKLILSIFPCDFQDNHPKKFQLNHRRKLR